MIQKINKYCGPIRIVVIDLGLTEEHKTELQAVQFVEFRVAPRAHKYCPQSLKSQQVYSLLLDFDVIVWADIGHFPEWDVRRLLDEFSVGTAFVGNYLSSPLPGSELFRNETKHSLADGVLERVVSSRFFAVIVDFRFYSRVLLPWVQCSSGLPCPTSMQEYASSLPANFTCQARDDALLTFLLTAFEAQRPRSVLLDVSLAASTSQPPTRASLGPPRLPRIGDSRTCRSSGPTTRSLCSCTLPGSPSSTAPASSCRRPARNTSTSRRSAPTCPKTRPRGLPRLRRGPPQPSCAREHGQGLAAGPRQGLARRRPRAAPPLAHQ